MKNELDDADDITTSEYEALRQKVDAVMAEASQAAAGAFAVYAETAQKAANGCIAGPPGCAYIYAIRPSFAFRTVMMEAGAMADSLSGRWNVGHFQDVVDDRSLIAAELTCEAALKVLRERFPDETFKSTSFPT